MPQLELLPEKSLTVLSQSSICDKWETFEDDNGTFYDVGRDFIRVFTGEGILDQSTFDEVLWDSTSESDYMALTRQNSTAIGKQFALHDLNNESEEDFMAKHPKQWTPNDIMQWSLHIAHCHNLNYEHMCMPGFNVDGPTLCNMTEEEFESRDPHFGKMLYQSLQYIISGQEYKGISLPHKSFLTELGEERSDFTSSQNSESEFSLGKETNKSLVATRPLKRPPGRPKGTRSKKKPEKKCGRLWEFIRDLLLNRDYCPSLICWDDHDHGVFRFVRSEKVAQLWGTIKENPKMTYEKLSRAMRYYYKSKVLQPVLGRRLVYKFGPTATGWRTPNPNFRLNL